MDHYDDTSQNLNILIIGNGIGELTKLQHETFPNAHIDILDVDFTTFEIAAKWFCNGFEHIDSIRLIRGDGVTYIKNLAADPGLKEYDIVIFDVSETAQWFKTKELYLTMKQIWKSWNQNKPRLTVLNAFLYNPYDKAIDVFGTNCVKLGNPQPANSVIMITSPNIEKRNVTNL